MTTACELPNLSLYEKIHYLYEFEGAVYAILGTPHGSLRVLAEGMWVNAHMWHGRGLDAELGAVLYVTDVIAAYHSHMMADSELAKFLGGH